MKEDNIVKHKSFDFAVRIIKLYQYLSSDKKEFILSKQILRSGTSVGAMIRESEHAQSKSDFIHKLSIAQKKLMKRFTGWNYFRLLIIFQPKNLKVLTKMLLRS